MIMRRMYLAGLCLLFWAGCEAPISRQTVVSISGEQFYLNGAPTYAGRTWQGHRVEGLLFNSRMVQGIFDDDNPETVSRFQYPDTGVWDPERNTREFIEAMPDWKAHGMLAFTLNLQGGSPMGYGNQGWRNSAFDTTGVLRPDYLARLQSILDRADELGMVVILGYFYFGQDEYLEDEAAVIRAVDSITAWLLDQAYTHVVIEVANECDNRGYDQDIIKADRIHELMQRIKAARRGERRLLVSTSFNGNRLPTPNVLRESDFVLLHGNGVSDPLRIMEMVNQTRAMADYRPMPIVFNEDDHYAFEQDTSNMSAAVMNYASWGYFDFRREGEPVEEGFQSVPVDWRISSPRKQSFFDKVKEMSGY